MKRTCAWLVCLMATTVSLESGAAPAPGFSGFASLGAGRLNRDSLQFMDYTSDTSFQSDSVIGLQAMAALSDRLSVTGQALAAGYTYDYSIAPWEVELEWLFVGYEITPELRLRVGRMRTPIYMLSDSLEVGYAYPWVRPPTEVYANFYEPFTNFNGMDLTWDTRVWGRDTEWGVFAGQEQGQFRDREAEIEQMAGAHVSMHAGDFLWRYCYVWNRVTYSDPLFRQGEDFYRAQAQALGQPILEQIAETLRSDRQVFQYHGLGVQWEHGDWSLISEKFHEIGPDEQFSSDIDGWYVSAARQFGFWMPYAFFGEYRTEVKPSIIDRVRDSFDVIPAGSNPLLDSIRRFTIFALEDVSIRQRVLGVGLRWDVLPNTAIKLQQEFYRMHSTGQMLFDDTTAMPDTAILTSAVIDVVF